MVPILLRMCCNSCKNVSNVPARMTSNVSELAHMANVINTTCWYSMSSSSEQHCAHRYVLLFWLNTYVTTDFSLLRCAMLCRIYCNCWKLYCRCFIILSHNIHINVPNSSVGFNFWSSFIFTYFAINSSLLTPQSLFAIHPCVLSFANHHIQNHVDSAAKNITKTTGFSQCACMQGSSIAVVMNSKHLSPSDRTCYGSE